MTASLARMRHAVGQHAAVQPAPPPTPRPGVDHLPPIQQILRGDWHDTPLGPVFVRDDWYPLDHCHGTLPLAAPLDSPAHALGTLLGAKPAPDASKLAFFDIETTGLSGGTGTYIVLAGLGSFEEGAFRMRQYFLADIGQERAMLSMLARDLARFGGIVTYNGRAFDLPFVQTRMTLARLPFPCDGMPHFDLLHAVRRLYKHRMPGCRLAEAERRLLRIERIDDVPGALIPSLYFDYVRAGRAAPLRGVFQHNAEDVLSLVGVLARLAALLSGGELQPEDAVAVARWWERAGDHPRAMDLYRGGLPWLEGEEDWSWAAARYARLCKRHAARDEAARFWQRLWAQDDALAGLELAKHLEHHERDHAAARRIVRTLQERGEPRLRDDLAKRLERLERKLAKATAATVTPASAP